MLEVQNSDSPPLASLTNDNAFRPVMKEIIKYRLADEIFGLQLVDWNSSHHPTRTRGWHENPHTGEHLAPLRTLCHAWDVICNLALAWAFTLWVFYNIRLPMKHFVTTHQQFFISPVHAKSVQANTVLVTGIPTRYLNPVALHAMFKDLPGGVKHVWVNRNLRTLPDIYDHRMPVTAEGSFSIQLTQVCMAGLFFLAWDQNQNQSSTPKRIGPLTGTASLLSWPWVVYNADYKGVLHANSADTYFFVSFLRMMVRIFLPIWTPNTKLNLFIIGNVQPDKQVRFYTGCCDLLVLGY
ncbi:hypothetical protein B0H14DRAFT_3438048 [Mycena olivaceomarginata]|nr:hypothetical protein B0H14DRAFT_3438048 [Mycena olivaceomarginata]